MAATTGAVKRKSSLNKARAAAHNQAVDPTQPATRHQANGRGRVNSSSARWQNR